MSEPYRIEREAMPSGSVVQLFRVIVALPGNRWGTVQRGLTRDDATDLCNRLLDNEETKRRAMLPRSGNRR